MSISLDKGQKISLTKADGQPLTQVRMGLGWDPVTKKGIFGKGSSGEIDLDASCVLLDSGRAVLDGVYYGQLTSRDGSIVHSGDNLTGDGDGDDEVINVDLTRVPANVEVLAFTINSYSNQGFSEVANAFCRLIDDTTGTEIARYSLSETGPHTGMVMAKLYRHNGTWKMAALGAIGSGQTYKQMVPAIQAAV